MSATIEKLNRELAAAREKITALQAERAAVARAALPEAEQVDNLRAAVAAIYRKAEPETVLPRFRKLRADGRRPELIADPLTLICLMMPQAEFEQRLIDQLRALNAGQELGLAREQREARIAEIESEIVRVERKEEATIMALEESGEEVLRRRDVNVDVLLQVWREADEKAEAA